MQAMGPAPTTEKPPAAPPPRLDRPILVSNLISGALCQLLLVALGMWPLAVLGAGYVAVGSVVLAAAYARAGLTPRQEIGSWVGVWLLAAALWAWIFYEPGFEPGTVGALAGWVSFILVIGAVCFLAWQLGALAVRRLRAATQR
jgi:hypothetical protein